MTMTTKQWMTDAVARLEEVESKMKQRRRILRDMLEDMEDEIEYLSDTRGGLLVALDDMHD